MKLVGLTGGVGMGKSAVQELLRAQGVPVVDTDVLARQVVEPGQPAWREIRRVFGPEMFDAAGRLRREVLARRVFSDAAARRQLESITHPRIRELWRQQVDVWRAEGRPLGVVAVPLLFEIGAESEFDVVVCVACSGATQRHRLLARGWEAEQIRQRVAAQLPVEVKMAKADYVVWTEGDKDLLVPQIECILRQITGGQFGECRPAQAGATPAAQGQSPPT